MTESEWQVCRDVESMLAWLWDRSPDMQWSDRKPRLLFVACCRPAMPRLPLEVRDLFALVEQAADSPDRDPAVEEAWELADRTAEGDAAQIVFALHYGDLGLACHVVAELCAAQFGPVGSPGFVAAHTVETLRQAACVRDIFGNPFHPPPPPSPPPTTLPLALARTIYDDRAFERLPDLADALERAGCTSPDLIAHCRAPGPHVRGCWALDLILTQPKLPTPLAD